VFQRLGMSRGIGPLASGEPVHDQQKWNKSNYQHREGDARYSRHAVAGERGRSKSDQREVGQRSGA
jgi:hypothetical protein